MAWPGFIFQVAVYALMAAPAPLIAVIWRRAFRRPRMPAAHRASLVVVTLSEVLLLLGIPFPNVIGSSYSDRRYATIWIDLGATLAVALLSALVRGEHRRLLVIAGLLLAFAWFYMAVMSAIV